MNQIKTLNEPKASYFYRWFDPRWRDLGYWAFLLNRVTALGLTLYLSMHLIVLGQLAQGPGAYDQFLKLIHNPIMVFGEWLVVAAGIIHGLNGIRIGLTSFGIAVPYQKQLFIGLMLVAMFASLLFAIHMFIA
jgi:succinate dehydrogenase / fumarate reductase, cytochrome b subunit